MPALKKLLADCLRMLYQTLCKEGAHDVPEPVKDYENWAFWGVT
jgi:hypothetical protein